MIGRPSAQAAVVPVTRSEASGRVPVPIAASAAVPGVVSPPAARDPAAPSGKPSHSRGDPRASPGITPAKYRKVFACASHARDAPTEEQRS